MGCLTVAKELKDCDWVELYNVADGEATVKSVSGTKKYHLATRYFPEHMVIYFFVFVAWIILMYVISAMATDPDQFGEKAYMILFLVGGLPTLMLARIRITSVERTPDAFVIGHGFASSPPASRHR